MAEKSVQWITVKGTHVPVVNNDKNTGKNSAKDTKITVGKGVSTSSGSGGIKGKKQVQKKFDKLNNLKGPK